jgi:AcrR family transcriptional regulator
LEEGGLRQKRKAATRARVLSAARELFIAVGYEAATVRQIADLAGVSVGSVFTSFACKADILSQVMEERLERLYTELEELVPRLTGSTADRLRAMFAFHFAFETPQVQLFLPHIAAAYDWTRPAGAYRFGRNPRIRGIMEDCLARGVADGDVDPHADLDAVIQLIVAAYAWCYRLAAWEGLGADTMTAAMDRQIDLIAQGFRPPAR